MPHVDGPLYYPVIATISLESPVLLDLYSSSASSSSSLTTCAESKNGVEVDSTSKHSSISNSKTDLKYDPATNFVPEYDPMTSSEVKSESEVMVSSGDSVKLDRIGSVYLQPRSLYVATENVYTEYLHGIREEINFDLKSEKILNVDVLEKAEKFDYLDMLERSKRVSITIRHVPKVLKNKLFIR